MERLCWSILLSYVKTHVYLDGQKYILIRVGTKRYAGVKFRLGLCRYGFNKSRSFCIRYLTLKHKYYAMKFFSHFYISLLIVCETNNSSFRCHRLCTLHLHKFSSHWSYNAWSCTSSPQYTFRNGWFINPGYTFASLQFAYFRQNHFHYA